MAAYGRTEERGKSQQGRERACFSSQFPKSPRSDRHYCPMEIKKIPLMRGNGRGVGKGKKNGKRKEVPEDTEDTEELKVPEGRSSTGRKGENPCPPDAQSWTWTFRCDGGVHRLTPLIGGLERQKRQAKGK